jgi:hypothetical protein
VTEKVETVAEDLATFRLEVRAEFGRVYEGFERVHKDSAETRGMLQRSHGELEGGGVAELVAGIDGRRGARATRGRTTRSGITRWPASVTEGPGHGPGEGRGRSGRSRVDPSGHRHG